MCEALAIQRTGFYTWKDKPKSKRQLEDERLTGLIKLSWLKSGCVYGYRKVTSDLKDSVEACSKHRLANIMRLEGIKTQVVYKKHKGHFSGKPAVVADMCLIGNSRLLHRTDIGSLTSLTFDLKSNGIIWLP